MKVYFRMKISEQTLQYALRMVFQREIQETHTIYANKEQIIVNKFQSKEYFLNMIGNDQGKCYIPSNDWLGCTSQTKGDDIHEGFQIKGYCNCQNNVNDNQCIR